MFWIFLMWILVFCKSCFCCGSRFSSQAAWQSGEPYKVKSRLLTLRYEASFLFFLNFPVLLCSFAFFRLFLIFSFWVSSCLVACIWCQDLCKEILFKVEKAEDRLICKRASGHLLKVVTARNSVYWEALNTGGISAVLSFPLRFPCYSLLPESSVE